ncbi:MBL fold metallo-hydrolase [bacterium]|nr:MBL fold metallo-hydrolase [bacterium]
MKILWLGHACFLITSSSGLRIITDPYEPNIGYAPVNESADIVTVSHDHFDHNAVKEVKGNPEIVRKSATVKGITFKGVELFHDDARGSKRGRNTVFVFNVDGINICHMGDLGHIPSTDQLRELGDVNILLIPVGGFYTIDARQATQIVDALKPNIVIPMHYKTEKIDFPISTVDEFLRGKENVERLPYLEVNKDNLPAPVKVVVLQYER